MMAARPSQKHRRGKVRGRGEEKEEGEEEEMEEGEGQVGLI